MEEELSVSYVLRKTYPFVILRLTIVILAVLAIYGFTVFMADFLFDLFNLRVEGILYTVFWMSFALIGCYVGVIVLGFAKRTILFYIRTAHVIAITKLCTDDVDDGSLTLISLKEMMKHFITVNVFYAADGILMKGIHNVGELIIQQDVVPLLKIDTADRSFLGRLKNLGFRLVGKVIEVTLSYCDEIVLSYIYVRSRLNELYGENKNKNKNKKDVVKETFGYAVDGICLYVKNCMPLLKKSFVLVLSVTAFGHIISIISGVVMFNMMGEGIVQALVVFVIIRITYSVLMYVFIEPYEIIVLITEFYAVLYEDTEELDMNPIKEKLLAMSLPFKQLVSRALGRDAIELEEKITAISGHILEEDLLEIATNTLEQAVTESNDNDENTTP